MPHMDSPLQPFVKPDGSIGAKPAQFNEEGELIPDPTWVAYLRRHMVPEREKLFQNVPVELSLGQPSTVDHLGWAEAYRDVDSGMTYINIALTEEASKALGNLVSMFEIKAVGFAGVKRRGGE